MKLKYKSKKYWYDLIFTCFFLAVIGYMNWKKIIVFDPQDLKSSLAFFLLNIYGLFLIKDSFYMLFGELGIHLTNQKLSLELNNGFYVEKTDYDLRKIEQLEIKYDVLNGYAWKWGGVIFRDQDKEILTFKYDGKEISVGRKMNGFDATGLKQAIHIRKN